MSLQRTIPQPFPPLQFLLSASPLGFPFPIPFSYALLHLTTSFPRQIHLSSPTQQFLTNSALPFHLFLPSLCPRFHLTCDPCFPTLSLAVSMQKQTKQNSPISSPQDQAPSHWATLWHGCMCNLTSKRKDGKILNKEKIFKDLTARI